MIRYLRKDELVGLVKRCWGGLCEYYRALSMSAPEQRLEVPHPIVPRRGNQISPKLPGISGYLSRAL